MVVTTLGITLMQLPHRATKRYTLRPLFMMPLLRYNNNKNKNNNGNEQTNDQKNNSPLPHAATAAAAALPLEVNDESVVKQGGGSNPYEIAKSNAQKNAHHLSKKHNISITFYDYISVVPNFAPNFSVNRMTKSGLDTGIIKFSDGDYGRPLLHTIEAGEFVVRVIEDQISRGSNIMKKSQEFDTDAGSDTVLVPGHFVTFKTFAETVTEAIETTYKDKRISFETYETTPDELRTRCVSSRWKSTGVDGVTPDGDSTLVIDGLKETAMHFIQHYDKESSPWS
mmetsp:Transcript_13004/g.19711  ORF Transcript_13004/g.19711 Transcript_13004/m.19711 type:complete len:282 (+) Transcript_13004:425-1270(+)